MFEFPRLPTPLDIGRTLAGHPWLAAAGVLGGGTAFLGYSVFYSGSQVFAPVIKRIKDRRAVALTFDDGPTPAFTGPVLDILARGNAKATFFLIGRNAQTNPDWVARIVAEGHTVGNHSWDHEHRGAFGSRSYWAAQVERTGRILLDVSGKRPVLFRAPMGFKTFSQARAVQRAGLRFVAWRVRAWDTLSISAHTITRIIKSRVRGGDILTLHDGLEPARRRCSQEQTVRALPRIIELLRDRGLRCVSLEAALDFPVYESTPGISTFPTCKDPQVRSMG